MVSEDYRPTIICPFSGSVILDQEGYHEPFPETFLYYYADENNFILNELEFVEAIEPDFEDLSLNKTEKRKLLSKIEEKFPWIQSEFAFYASHLLQFHPKIEVFIDLSDYQNPGTSAPYIYCFSKVEDIPSIISELKNLHTMILDYNKLKIDE